MYLCFCFYTATAVHEAGALAPANVHGVAPWRTLFRTLFPILYRSHIISLFEQAIEMLHILVTNVSCYGLYCLVGFLQEHSCLLHAFFPYNLLEGHAGLFLNVFGQIRLGEMEGIYQRDDEVPAKLYAKVAEKLRENL